MTKTQRRVKEHKYLVCAIYHVSSEILTRIQHVEIVMASSPLYAINKAKRKHKTNGIEPRKYVASIILGPFQTNPSGRTYTCEELLSTK